jgi:hypothetical protein
MISRRRLGSLVIAAFSAVPARGVFAPIALGYGLGLPTAVTVLTRPAGEATGSVKPLATLGRAESDGFSRDRSELPLQDPGTPAICRTRRC